MTFTNANYNSQVPWGFHGSDVPTKASSITIAINSMMERSWDDTVDLILNTPSTVSLSVIGLNGILTSSALAGTVTATSGSNVINRVSGTADLSVEFKVGDVINLNNGALYQVVTEIVSATQIKVRDNLGTTFTGVSFQRGGRSARAVYNLYAIGKADGSDPAFVLSNRSVVTGETLVDLPAGYSKYRQLPASFVTDSGGMFYGFTIVDWPYCPTYLFTTALSSAAGSYLTVFNGTAPTTATTLSCAYAVPKTSRAVLLSGWNNTNASIDYYLQETGVSASKMRVLGEKYTNFNTVKVFTSSTQTIEHYAGAASAGVFLTIVGHVVTEMI
ncbi:MAG: hypothetical protein K0S07_1352 [Chlamydiales bacterium]|jgi:hypothetical protein|nr:hypothetical protein [Chlamydiales bacterium]